MQRQHKKIHRTGQPHDLELQRKNPKTCLFTNAIFSWPLMKTADVCHAEWSQTWLWKSLQGHCVAAAPEWSSCLFSTSSSTVTRAAQLCGFQVLWSQHPDTGELKYHDSSCCCGSGGCCTRRRWNPPSVPRWIDVIFDRLIDYRNICPEFQDVAPNRPGRSEEDRRRFYFFCFPAMVAVQPPHSHTRTHTKTQTMHLHDARQSN